jgi:hypothetical protein
MDDDVLNGLVFRRPLDFAVIDTAIRLLGTPILAADDGEDGKRWGRRR